MNKTLTAILIPAFNEEKTLRAIVQQCLMYSNHIIVVDDGSTDKTVDSVKDLPITILRNALNRGKDASLLRGFAYTQNLNVQAVITMDADTQHNPQDIPHFLRALEEHPTRIIIGARILQRENAPRHRLWANKTADFFISWAAGCRIIDTQSGFRLYPSAVLPKLIHKASRYDQFVFESKVLIDATRAGYSPISVPIVSCYPEDARQSYFRPISDSTRIFRMITWRILSRGFCLKGLYTTLFQSAETFEYQEH